MSYLTPDRTKPITARRLGDDFDCAAYRQKHKGDFIIYQSALPYFKANSITKLPTYKGIQVEIEKLIAEKNAAYNTYYADKERFNELKTIQQNLAQMMNIPKRERSKKHKQSL